jgi:hypothetical protein
LGRFGFGRSKAKSKPRPSDNKTIIIFVIGGITCAEIQEALQHVAESVEDDGYQVSLPHSHRPVGHVASSLTQHPSRRVCRC